MPRWPAGKRSMGNFFTSFFLLMSVCTVFEHHQAIGVITVIIIHTGVFRVRAGIPRRTECIEEEVSVLRTIVASVWMLSGPVRILLFFVIFHLIPTVVSENDFSTKGRDKSTPNRLIELFH